ncbi:hypothetical protein H9K76_22500 [Diaphorobacter ruginosibacter]|uniref:Uncharacterized protein n=1 Tax=Diaphorobacter ruginosibacter TaxID=1715720 RepID=A0A7G9RNM2_9BURK|nr:hypothetical protein [Diaphorobacter ruginosibacter]QNN57197.1 hypothetical protein H9K76_22500 [Diaphorobacter ruginosibacter]
MRTSIRQVLARFTLAAGVLAAAALPVQARAQSDASLALSMMPVASVIVGVGASGAAAGAVVAIPVALSVGGATLVVKAVEASAIGTVYLLERASDGAQASIEVAGKGSRAVVHGVGTAVECSLVTGGVVLSVAGAVIAFIPDAIGQALLYNERL